MLQELYNAESFSYMRFMEIKRNLRRLFPSVLDKAIKQSKLEYLVKDVMSYPVVTVPQGTDMMEASKSMGRKRIGSLIVVKDGKSAGIVTERDLLSRVIARGLDLSEVNVTSVMSSPLITIEPNKTVKKAAKMMMEKKGRLVVLSEEELVGIITASDLVKGIPETETTLKDALEYASKQVITADEEKSVSTVAKTMGDRRIGSVVITSDDVPVGIFTERDLITKLLAEDKELNIPVGDVMSSPLIAVPHDISVIEAAFTMETNKIKRLPLANEDNNLVGIITARDLVEAFAG